jgi:hypothetical protein
MNWTATWTRGTPTPKLKLSTGQTAVVSSWDGVVPCSRIDVGSMIWCKVSPHGACEPTTRPVEAQHFNTATVKDANGDSIYLFYGERWQTGPDGRFAHGFSHWEPLRFDADGSVLPLQNVSSFEIDLPD